MVSPASEGYLCLNTHWVWVMAFDKLTGINTHGYSPVLHLNYTIGNEETYNMFLEGLPESLLQDTLKPPIPSTTTRQRKESNCLPKKGQSLKAS